MRLKTRISTTLSSSSAEENDLANYTPLSYEISDAQNEGSGRKVRIANGAADEGLSLAGIEDVAYLFIRTSKPITLRLTYAGAAQLVPVTIPDGFDFGQFCVTTSGLTGLAVDNGSGGTAEIYIIMAGDPS